MKYKNEIEISGDSKKEVRVDFKCFADNVLIREECGIWTNKEWKNIECLADELLNLSYNPASVADDEDDGEDEEEYEHFYENFASDVCRAKELFNKEMIVKHVALIGENYDADDMIDFDVEGETVSEHVGALESHDINDSNIVINSLDCYDDGRELASDVFNRCCELWSQEKEKYVSYEFSCAICDKTVSVLFDSKSVEETICPECLKQIANAIWFNQDSLFNEESSMYDTLVNYVVLLYKRVGKNEDERLNFLSSSDFECSDEFKNLSFEEFVDVAQEKNEELIIKLFEINEIDII